jgi:hypothetical protein
MRWQPSPEQIALGIDCAVARIPIERAAELLGVKPRTLRSFCRRIGARQKAITSGTGAAEMQGRPGGLGA